MEHRFLTKMFPTSYKFKGTYVLGSGNGVRTQWAATPFRIVMNAGDPMARQTAQSSINQLSTKTMRWSVRDSSGEGDGASGNQHYVYDHSVYVKYKGLVEKNKKYVYERSL